MDPMGSSNPGPVLWDVAVLQGCSPRAQGAGGAVLCPLPSPQQGPPLPSMDVLAVAKIKGAECHYRTPLLSR